MMRSAACATCHSSSSLGTLFQLGGALYCQRCVADAEQRSQGSGEVVRQAVDPTVCANCARDNGSTEFPRLAGAPVCDRCAKQFRERPFPGWLKLSFVGLVGLLAASLLHGRPYFEAGTKLVRAERLMSAGQYRPAAGLLGDVLKVAPNSDKVILLKLKADLLAGQYQDASALAAQHKGRKFKSAMLKEINQTFERADRAMAKAQEAGERFAQNRAEAARLLREAATLYPEAADLTDAADRYDGAVAFEGKDYGRFLAVAEKLVARNPESPDDLAMLASALACHYAVRGEPGLKQKSLETIERARALAAKDPEARARLDGFEDRMRYRLQSRQIIDTKEYERRFGAQARGPRS